ncbi:MAG: beta-L-arabinofuranosidase domain-containing protein [Bacteroidota bacterium]
MTKHNILKAPLLTDVSLSGVFWDNYNDQKIDGMIAHQYSAFTNTMESYNTHGALHSLELLSGRRKGEEPFGMVWNDSDLFKWYEGLCNAYAHNPTEKWREVIDYIADMLEEAQDSDGYYNTWFQLDRGGKRFENVRENHEMYSMGNVISACISHYRATGTDKLLKVAIHLADHICSVFGLDDGKLPGYCGHQEIEIDLINLYRVTGDKKYLDQSRYFLYQRGKEPFYFITEWENRGRTVVWDFTGPEIVRETYLQTHLPMEEQMTAEGHAVRATYMYTAMADVAALTDDDRLLEQCRTLWDNITLKRMYITGGVGSYGDGERFGGDYDLPNKAYAETCAGIGMVFFAQRMFNIEKDSKYTDILEKVLYNNVLASSGLDLKTCFYTNTLERSKTGGGERGKWQGCACCPTNVARFFSSFQIYTYSFDAKSIYINLFAQGESTIQLDNTKVKLSQKTNYPWDGRVAITVNPEQVASFTVAVRLPAWCDSPSISLNGQVIDKATAIKGYIYIERIWSKGDVITLDFPMQATVVRSHPFVVENHSKYAVTRGPIVYCIEDKDNGENLNALAIDENTKLSEQFIPDFLNGCMVINAQGYRAIEDGMEDTLYKPQAKYNYIHTNIRFIPYYTWSNRGNGEMLVWVWEKR